MYLRLDRVDDGMARTLINKDAVMKQGYFCKIKGLVNPLEKSGVAVDGEALEAVALVDEANALFEQLGSNASEENPDDDIIEL